MCFHSQQTKDAQTLQNRFKAKIKNNANVQSKHFNGFAHPQTPIITNTQPQVIQMYNWGLIPNWAKDESIRKYTLNAKIETLTEKPSFKNCINNRCIILIDGFMEWQWLDAKGKQKKQFLISMPNHEAFALAGIYSSWQNIINNTIMHTYSIITTEANELMSQIHNSKKRMPIVLTPQNENEWLAEKNYLDFKKCETNLIATEI